MSEPCKKPPDDQKPPKHKKVEQPSRKVKPFGPRLSLKDILPSFKIAAAVAYLKGLCSRKSSEVPKDVQPIPENITKLITATEEKIQQFYGVILKKVKDFVKNDLQQLKNYSQEELGKTKTALSEYSVQIQRISEEKFKRLAEIKSELQTKIATFEEVQKLSQFFETKFAEVGKLTEELFKKIRKSDELPVTKDLKNIMETNINNVKIATAALLVALKVGNDSKTDFPGLTTHVLIKEHSTKVQQLKEILSKKKFTMPAVPKIPKLPEIPKGLRIPGIERINLFNRKIVQADDAKAAPKKPLIPLLVKEKLQFFNLGKVFNSETIYGRANVTKATYAGILIYYLYRKVKGAGG